jgi:hypothetical protein
VGFPQQPLPLAFGLSPIVPDLPVPLERSSRGRSRAHTVDLGFTLSHLDVLIRIPSSF